MKKFTKCLAVISSAVMALSVGVMQVSAFFNGKCYDTIETSPMGVEYPVRTYENVVYNGIVVTMPDSTAPTSEDLGIDCTVEKYDSVSYGCIIGDVEEWNEGWLVDKSVESEDNQYYLDCTDVMSEDEAIEFAEKLMIRNKVKKAEVLYEYHINRGTIYSSGDKNAIKFTFRNESAANDFSVDKYPEIKEILKYSEYSEPLSNVGNNLEVLRYCSFAGTEYVTDGYDSVKIYNDVNKLNEVLTAKYDEIEDVELLFLFPVADTVSNAVYSVEPTWGDATNDDVINLYDAIEISKYIMNISDMDEDTVLLADINRDGKTDLYDAIEVAKTLL